MRASLSLAALVLVLTGCGARLPREAPDEATDGAVVVASAVDMRGVNELTAGATSLHTALFYYGLFLPLLDEQADFQNGPPSFAPRLAESYEFSADRKVLTFELRDDVVWSDGEPVTAGDVRWTWQAQTHPEVAWSAAESKRYIRDVEVVGPHTVRFHFDRVYATQLLDANLGVVLPEHAWSALPFSEWRTRNEWFVDHLVVAGPFDLELWEPNQRIVLRRNERYFDRALPRAERIVFRITPDRAGQLALLRAGEAHVVARVSPADVALLERMDGVEIFSYVPRSSKALVWNVEHPLFAAKEVRQALTLAIDRQEIVEALHYGHAKVTDLPFMSGLWACNRELAPRPYDPGLAAQLLAAQGWHDRGGDGVLERADERFSFEILTAAGNDLLRDVLVMVQHQLARVGIEARQRAVEYNTLLAHEQDHDFEATLTSMAVGTDLDLSFRFHSSAIDGGFNFGRYSSGEVDRLLDELKNQVDQAAAKPLYDRLQALLYEDAPLTILYEPLWLVAVREELSGVSPNALSTYFGLERWELREGF